MRSLYRILSIMGTVKAARRGPSALARREVRRQSNKHFNRWLRKLVKP